MALVTEIIPPEEEGGWTLVRNYSNIGMMIRQNGTGELYDEAVDPDFTNRTYTETNIPVDSEEESDDEGGKAIEILDTLLGE
jgi:hypothetical protein